MSKKIFKMNEILPHDYPMIFIDKVLSCNLKNKTLTAQVIIKDTMPFYNSKIKGISSVVGIEFMAQAIACFAFFKNNHKVAKFGLLLGSRLYHNSIKQFELGKKYCVSINEIFFDEQICSFDCQIFDENNEEISCATINALQGNDDKGISYE